MGKRLKQQRNKLFSRVISILAAVCIIVCAAYSAIYLYGERNSIQNSMIEDMSYAKIKINTSTKGGNVNDVVYSSISDLIYQTGRESRDWNSQLAVLDGETGETLVNTSKKIVVTFGIKVGLENSEKWEGFIDQDVLRRSLTDSQYREITEQLKAERDDGKSCELICTKFNCKFMEFIPLELKTAAVGADNTWFISDEIVQTYSLDSNAIPGEPVYVCNEMTRNIIPKEFVLGSDTGSDLIKYIDDDLLASPLLIVHTGTFEDIYYVSDSVVISDRSAGENAESTEYIIRYAKKADLLKASRSKLAAGIGIIVFFFTVITFILCFMLWKMIKAQAVQEQQRTDLTNAIAHDIKTPIFIISGYAYSLKEDIDESERERYLDKIIEQSDAVNELVHKMLEFSKLNSSEVTLNRKEFDLYKPVKNIADSFPALPDKKSIKLTHSGDNTVSADEELIKTAVGNLIDNAVRYSLPETEITIDVSDKTLTIENESEPLTNDELQELCRPYARKDKSRHRRGNGLGLSIVRSIAELHKAEFTMKMNGTKLECTLKL